MGAASAAAFAPAQQSRVSTAIAGDARSPDGLGVDPGPLDLFDPLGLAEDTDSFARRRTVEIKHGRICMAAFIGMMVQELTSPSLDPLTLREKFLSPPSWTTVWDSLLLLPSLPS